MQLLVSCAEHITVEQLRTMGMQHLYSGGEKRLSKHLPDDPTIQQAGVCLNVNCGILYMQVRGER